MRYVSCVSGESLWCIHEADERQHDDGRLRLREVLLRVRRLYVHPHACNAPVRPFLDQHRGEPMKNDCIDRVKTLLFSLFGDVGMKLQHTLSLIKSHKKSTPIQVPPFDKRRYHAIALLDKSILAKVDTLHRAFVSRMRKQVVENEQRKHGIKPE